MSTLPTRGPLRSVPLIPSVTTRPAAMSKPAPSPKVLESSLQDVPQAEAMSVIEFVEYKRRQAKR
jgi:hypothetical protein